MRMAVENDVKNDNEEDIGAKAIHTEGMCAGSGRRYERGANDREAKAIYSCKRHHERVISNYRALDSAGAIERLACTRMQFQKVEAGGIKGWVLKVLTGCTSPLYMFLPNWGGAGDWSGPS
jgi:hypothetical protein